MYLTKYQIIITRKFSIVGAAKSYTVALDGDLVGKLGNGKSISVYTTEGNHTLSFTAFGKQEKIIDISVLPQQYNTKIFATLNKLSGKIELRADEDGDLLSPHQRQCIRVLEGSPTSPSFKIPFREKAREDLAGDLLSTASLSAKLAGSVTYVSTFLEEWDKMIGALENLKFLEGKVKSMHGSPTADVYRLNSEFQWKLRDAIERAKDATLSDINGKFRNGGEHKKHRAEWFIDDICENKHRYSEETIEFAINAAKQVQQAAGLPLSVLSQLSESPDSHVSVVVADFRDIDSMEGHNFECWCADLLRKIGFVDVEVTKGSGDQGVDILAKKDGIKYAIQCKCYSSDLGNKPVQEVHAGKNMYHCQVGAVLTNRHFTSGAVELATATGVLLWDRDWITRALQQFSD